MRISTNENPNVGHFLFFSFCFQKKQKKIYCGWK
jgi:hypothetical protein